MLAPSPTDLFPEHECPHRFLRTLHEGLRLWSVDIASPDFALLVLSIEHRDRVPIGHTNHGASQRFSVKKRRSSSGASRPRVRVGSPFFRSPYSRDSINESTVEIHKLLMLRCEFNTHFQGDAQFLGPKTAESNFFFM